MNTIQAKHCTITTNGKTQTIYFETESGVVPVEIPNKVAEVLKDTLQASPVFTRETRDHSLYRNALMRCLNLQINLRMACKDVGCPEANARAWARSHMATDYAEYLEMRKRGSHV